MAMKQPIVAVFDFDGTIVDSLDIGYKIVKKICDQEKIDLFRNKEEFIALYDKNFYITALSKGLSPRKLLTLYNQYKVHADEFLNGLQLFPGMKGVLAQLDRGYIVTSNHTEVVERYAKKHKLHYITVIGADKQRSKMKKLRAIQDQNKGYKVYYVGDTVGDVKEAKRAGV